MAEIPYVLDEPAAATPAQGFTRRDVLRIVFKHWLTIVLTFLVVSVSLALGLNYLPPTYVAEGKLLVKTEQQATPAFFAGIAAYREVRDSDPVNRKIETEMEIIATRGISEAVVRELDLKYNDVYHPAYVHLLNPVADLYDELSSRWFGTPKPASRYGFAATVRDFNRSLSIGPLRSKSADTTSNLIGVKIPAPDPEVARAALQRLLLAYVNYTVASNQASGLEARKIIDQNAAEAKAQVLDAQKQLRTFLSQIGPGDRALALSASERRGGDSARAAGIDEGDIGTLRVLRTRLTEIDLQLADARLNYQDDSDHVRNLVSRSAELRKRITRGTVDAAKGRTTEIQLERELRGAEELYSELRRRSEQIALFLAANPQQADNRDIVEPPLVPPSSEWRKTLLFWLIGSMGGLALGFGIAGFRAYGDHTLETAEDVARYLGVPAVAVLPSLSRRDLARLDDPDRAVSLRSYA